jgi:hypothetical protein
MEQRENPPRNESFTQRQGVTTSHHISSPRISGCLPRCHSVILVGELNSLSRVPTLHRSHSNICRYDATVVAHHVCVWRYDREGSSEAEASEG